MLRHCCKMAPWTPPELLQNDLISCGRALRLDAKSFWHCGIALLWHCNSFLAVWHCGVVVLRHYGIVIVALQHCRIQHCGSELFNYSCELKLKHFLPSFLPLRLIHFYKELIKEVLMAPLALSSLIQKSSRTDTKYCYSVVISHSAPIKTLRHCGNATLPQLALRQSTIQCFVRALMKKTYP